MSTRPLPDDPPAVPAPTRRIAPAVLEARRTDLAIRDLSDPAAGPHAIQRVLDEAVARDTRYTRYLSEHLILRSHTSAMVPDALARLGQGPVDDELLVCVGMVYRRDAIDRLHTGTPHQVDLWRIATRPLSELELESMVATVVRGVLPGVRWRTEARSHPYTDRGRQIDVHRGDEWIEIGECGLVPPELLAEGGLDPARHRGLALGLGLDRLLMLRKGLEDVRLLRANDPRISCQMLDLEPYRPVSGQPAMTRDLSIAVATEDTDQDLGDRVRGALGPESSAVESVEVVSETSWNDLPAAARARLGMRADQKNLLVRVVLRDLDRTLTAYDANRLRDRIYAALHRGHRRQWAAGRNESVNRDGE